MSNDAATPQNPVEPLGDRDLSLPLRGDTFLGVCEGLSQEFGIPANLLRVGFAALFFWSMELSVVAYLAIGGILAVARWAFPRPKQAPVRAAEEPAEEPHLPLAA